VYIVLEKHIYGMSIATTTTVHAPAPVCPGAPQKAPKSAVSRCGGVSIKQLTFDDDTPSSPGTPLGDNPQLSLSMRTDQTPSQSPTGSPMCPSAPHAPIYCILPTWGSLLPQGAPGQ